jgi:hypothetical protein
MLSKNGESDVMTEHYAPLRVTASRPDSSASPLISPQWSH